MKWTDENAKITVDMDREGPLASQGHSLRFGFDSFEISYDDSSRDMVAVVKTESIAYIAVIKEDGSLDTDGLSTSDQAKVVKSAKEKILDVNTYHSARFEANIPDMTHKSAVSGKLTLCGVTRPITFEIDVRDDEIVAHFSLLQSDYNIKQYSAFLGALKVANALYIRVTLYTRDAITS